MTMILVLFILFHICQYNINYIFLTLLVMATVMIQSHNVGVKPSPCRTICHHRTNPKIPVFVPEPAFIFLRITLDTIFEDYLLNPFDPRTIDLSNNLTALVRI